MQTTKRWYSKGVTSPGKPTRLYTEVFNTPLIRLEQNTCCVCKGSHCDKCHYPKGINSRTRTGSCQDRGFSCPDQYLYKCTTTSSQLPVSIRRAGLPLRSFKSSWKPSLQSDWMCTESLFIVYIYIYIYIYICVCIFKAFVSAYSL